jgi:hypothetical protein
LFLRIKNGPYFDRLSFRHQSAFLNRLRGLKPPPELPDFQTERFLKPRQRFQTLAAVF